MLKAKYGIYDTFSSKPKLQSNLKFYILILDQFIGILMKTKLVQNLGKGISKFCGDVARELLSTRTVYVVCEFMEEVERDLQWVYMIVAIEEI